MGAKSFFQRRPVCGVFINRTIKMSLRDKTKGERMSEKYIPYLDRTPEERAWIDKGMDKLQKRFRNKHKFFPRLKRAGRNFVKTMRGEL
jgi:hypothetical protein